MGEEAEYKGRGDLVRCIGDADIKVGQSRFDEIADHDIELALLWPVKTRDLFEYSEVGKLEKARTFPALASSTPLPYEDPSQSR